MWNIGGIFFHSLYSEICEIFKKKSKEPNKFVKCEIKRVIIGTFECRQRKKLYFFMFKIKYEELPSYNVIYYFSQPIISKQ